MKKILIPIVFIIAFLLAGTPFVVGIMIKSETEDFITQLNESTPYTAEWQSYNAGWLSSGGVLNLKLEFPVPDNESEMKDFFENFQLDLDVDINHGPFLKENGLGWAEWEIAIPEADKLRKYIEWDSDKSLYEVTGNLGLTGNIHHKESIPVIKSPANSEIAFAFGGYLGTGETKNGSFIYKGKSGSTEINSALFTASIGPLQTDMTADADFEAMFSGGLYNAKGNVVIPNIGLHGIQSFELDNFEIKYAIELPEPDSANISFSYLIDAIETEGFTVSDIAIEMAMENYSAGFHDQYMQFAQDISYSGNSEPDPEAVQEFMANALPLLVAAGPVFKIENLAFKLPSGNFASNAQIKLDPVSSMPANSADMTFWMDKIYAEASISADQDLVNYIGNIVLTQKMVEDAATPSFELNEETGEFVEAPEVPQMTEVEIAEAVATQMQQGIGMLEGMGIVILDGNTYKSDFKYDHGNTQVNGQEFALPF